MHQTGIGINMEATFNNSFFVGFRWLSGEPFWGCFQPTDLLGLLGLLGQENSLDVGEDTTLGNGHSGQEFVQFLVITDGQLQVTWDDPGLLVVTGSIACQLQDLSCEVLHDGSQVDWGTSTYTFGIVAFSQMPVDSSNRELETSTG